MPFSNAPGEEQALAEAETLVTQPVKRLEGVLKKEHAPARSPASSVGGSLASMRYAPAYTADLPPARRDVVPIFRSVPETLPEAFASLSAANVDSALPVFRKETDLIGVRLEGRYEVLSMIGKGTFGAVFRGRNVRTDGIVAIKVLIPSVVSGTTGLGCDNLLRRFELEARAASQLTHGNVVRVFDFGRHENCAFMIMQLLEGPTLMDIIEKESPVNPVTACHWMADACSALSEAHDNKLIHRDLKPHNIMLMKNAGGAGRIKVLDFGTVKGTDADWSGAGLTADGTVLGTAWYMSPEQAKGETLDVRSDLYAIAVILFELVTGQLPFDSPHAAKVMLHHVKTPAPGLETANSKLSQYPKLCAIVAQTLAKDRSDRPESALKMQSALLIAAQEVEAVDRCDDLLVGATGS
ncbi:MAG: serine/threonine protein kinase [Bradymonadia bacterium]|jgi:serine/threonine protein kinase